MAEATEKYENNRLVTLVVWGIPVIIVASYGFLASCADLRLDQAGLIAATGVIIISLASGLTLLDRLPRPRLWSPASILLVAAVVRLLFLFRSPELSDDLYRYLWDGFQLIRGRNPYALAPSEAAHLMPDLAWLSSHINHPGLITLYPPAAQLLFAAAAAVGGTLTSLKTLLVLLDLALCALLLRWLPCLRLPADRAVLYAWHPLPVLEIAASGHVDGAGVLFVFMALALLTPADRPPPPPARPSWNRAQEHEGEEEDDDAPLFFTCRKHFAAGIVFAWAVLTKVFPLVYLPFPVVLLRGRRRVAFIAGIALASVLLTVPFLPELLNGLKTLGLFAATWDFSGFLYRSLLAINLPAATARLILGGVFLAVMALCTAFLFIRTRKTPARTRFGMFCSAIFRGGVTFLRPQIEPGGDKPRPYALPRKHVRVSKKIALAGGHSREQQSSGASALTSDAAGRLRQVLLCGSLTALAFLLLTPNLQPWYALWLVAFLPFAPGPAEIILSWSVFLAYRVLIPYTLLNQWTEEPLTRAVVWGAPVAALLLGGLTRLWTRSKNAGASLR